MLRPVDHSSMAIAGYADPINPRPGQTVGLCLSTAEPVTAVRVVRLDRDGLPRVDWPVASAVPVERRGFGQGSFLSIDAAALGAVQRIGFELKLTANPDRRTIVASAGCALLVEDDQLLWRDGTTETLLGTVPRGRWLGVDLDLAAGQAEVTSLEPYHPFALHAPISGTVAGELRFGSDLAEAQRTLNARLARIGIEGEAGAANWRFPALYNGTTITADTDLPMAVHNAPTFCVTSARWTGDSLDPRLTPEGYDAIHLHDTDIGPFDWPANFAVTVPADAPSGVYAFEVTAGAGVERVPFFVAAAEPKTPLLFVVPTATYLAYANEFLPEHLYPWIGSDRGHRFARDNDLRSLYDFHSDGSGVSLASWRKPLATLRDDYRYPLCGDPHLLPVDLQFLRFCAREGIAIDVATDFDLHAGGAELLGRYRGVVTGSHPEYLSDEMEAAYRAYIGHCGRLAYLGGNGFAAAVAFQDDLMELRRGPTQAGRTWDGPLAELNFALNNKPAGYFRDRGRGEYSLVGVGIALMGFTEGRPYRRTALGQSERFAWLFDGVAGESFGHGGTVLGAAAGYEVDCTNFHLGTPAGVEVLAVADGFAPSYVGDAGKWYPGGEPEKLAARRADMLWWEHPSGGTVFAASSVAWCGALPLDENPTDVGRITRNLLRFLAK